MRRNIDKCFSGNGRRMLSCKGPHMTLLITNYYSLELLCCGILRVRVVIFNPYVIRPVQREDASVKDVVPRSRENMLYLFSILLCKT